MLCERKDKLPGETQSIQVQGLRAEPAGCQGSLKQQQWVVSREEGTKSGGRGKEGGKKGLSLEG